MNSLSVPLETVAKNDLSLYYRLTALWILSEAMLGGILHGLKIPGSGLIVGSSAVVCICLIGHFAPAKGAIFKAAMMVALFKITLSPQTPPTAFIAVFFQAMLGEALFWNRRMYPLSCLLLGIFALLESGIQRILVLTFVYGQDLWKALDAFIAGITGQTSSTHYSFFIMAAYVSIHLAAGIMAGLWAGSLPAKISVWMAADQHYLIRLNEVQDLALPVKRKRIKTLGILIWVTLLILYAQSAWPVGPPLLPGHVALKILMRSLLIILSFYFVVTPVMNKLINKWLEKTKNRENPNLQIILNLLPDTQEMVQKSWLLSSSKKGIRRIMLYCRIVLLNTFYLTGTQGRIMSLSS